MSKHRIQWLPTGHVTHGYRRVFTVYENNKLKHIVNLSMMQYEAVYQIKQLAGSNEMTDPALWWGLSLVVKLLKDSTAFAESDDGYIQLRPQLLAIEELVPIDVYQKAVEEAEFKFE